MPPKQSAGSLAKETIKSLPQGAKATAKEFGKNTKKGLDVWKNTAQNLAKVPIRVGASLADVPRTVMGQDPLKPFNVPGLGMVKTHARNAVDRAGSMGARASALRAGSEAILDVASMGAISQALMNKTGVSATSASDAKVKAIEANIDRANKITVDKMTNESIRSATTEPGKQVGAKVLTGPEQQKLVDLPEFKVPAKFSQKDFMQSNPSYSLSAKGKALTSRAGRMDVQKVSSDSLSQARHSAFRDRLKKLDTLMPRKPYKPLIHDLGN